MIPEKLHESWRITTDVGISFGDDGAGSPSWISVIAMILPQHDASTVVLDSNYGLHSVQSEIIHWGNTIASL
jgi:hypothetical protein